MLVLCFAILLVFSNRGAESSSMVGGSAVRLAYTMGSKKVAVVCIEKVPEGSFWKVHCTRQGKKVLVEWLPRHPDVERAVELFRGWYIKNIINKDDDDPYPDLKEWYGLPVSIQIGLILELQTYDVEAKDNVARRELYSLFNYNPLLFYLLNRARDRCYMQEPVRGMVRGINRPHMDFRLAWSPWNESEA